MSAKWAAIPASYDEERKAGMRRAITGYFSPDPRLLRFTRNERLA